MKNNRGPNTEQLKYYCNSQSLLFQKHLGHNMAEFQVDVIAHWADGLYTLLSQDNVVMDTNIQMEESVDGNNEV